MVKRPFTTVQIIYTLQDVDVLKNHTQERTTPTRAQGKKEQVCTASTVTSLYIYRVLEQSVRWDKGPIVQYQTDGNLIVWRKKHLMIKETPPHLSDMEWHFAWVTCDSSSKMNADLYRNIWPAQMWANASKLIGHIFVQQVLILKPTQERRF